MAKRMTDEQLAALKPGEGSYALQDAAAAARRRLAARKTPKRSMGFEVIDRIAADHAAAQRAAYDALIRAIEDADSTYSMKCITRSALRKQYPDYAETEAAQ